MLPSNNPRLGSTALVLLADYCIGSSLTRSLGEMDVSRLSRGQFIVGSSSFLGAALLKRDALAIPGAPPTRYALGAIPQQRCWAGDTLSFQVSSPDRSTLSILATPRPKGAVVFDGVTGLFSYTALEDDLSPFQVTFYSATIREVVDIVPLPHVPDDAELLPAEQRIPPPYFSDLKISIKKPWD